MTLKGEDTMTVLNINAQQLKEKIEKKETFLVDFWASWCPHCRKINPAYEELAKEYAGKLPFVKLDMDENDDLWDDFDVELIPTLRLYVEGVPVSSVVAPDSKEALHAFLSPLMPREAEKNQKSLYDMLIIGGGPGGYTAALYAARAGLKVLLLEKLGAGGQMALSHQIDNYPGFPEGIGGFELGEEMKKQAEKFGTKTKNATVKAVDLAANPKAIETEAGVFYGKTVVLATGANPKELGIPDEKELVGKGVAYCAACDGMFYQGKTVAVVGGGNSAAADAMLLSRMAKKVILIHRRDTLRATKIYHDPLFKAENVEFKWNSAVTELLHEDRLTALRLKNTQTGEESLLPVDGVFVSIGRKPATELIKDQLPLDENGYLIAGETTETALPGVYAVGDVRTKLLRQVVTAVADGAMAVHMAEEFLAANP